MTTFPGIVSLNETQEQAERYRDLFEEAPVAYHEIDCEGVIREVNHTECSLLGYERHELIGRPIWEFVAAEARETARGAIAAKVARQMPLSVVMREYRRSDGLYLWLEIHEKLMENAEGEVTGIRSVLFDITERHEFEQELLKQRDWMRYALRSAIGAVLTTDALGHLVVMNPAAERLTGWRQEEAVGKPLEKICPVWHHPGAAVDLLSCILSEPVVSNRSRNFVVIDRAGVAHPVQWRISPISNDSDVVIGAMVMLETALPGAEHGRLIGKKSRSQGALSASGSG